MPRSNIKFNLPWMLILILKSSRCSDFKNYNKYFTCYYNKHNKIEDKCCYEYNSNSTKMIFISRKGNSSLKAGRVK